MVEKVSMSHRAISGYVEGLGAAGRKRSKGEFVPQRERAGFIAEECLRGATYVQYHREVRTTTAWGEWGGVLAITGVSLSDSLAVEC